MGQIGHTDHLKSVGHRDTENNLKKRCDFISNERQLQNDNARQFDSSDQYDLFDFYDLIDLAIELPDVQESA